MNAPSPISVGPDVQYQRFLAAGTFRIQKCGGCGRHVFFPRVLCPHCGARKLEWVTPSGMGTVYSFSVVAAKPENGGDYNVSLIDLDEGARLMSRVEGVAPSDITVGMRVKAQVSVKDGASLLLFVPEDRA